MKKQILTLGAAMLFTFGSATFFGCGNEEHHENTAVFNGEKVKDLSLILNSYFELKNALVKDDADKAAESAEKMLSAFNDFDMSVVSEDNMKTYMEITEDAVENAEHISKNAGKIGHQREHLVNLSEDMNDLIALIGTDKKLYQDFCPMANDGNGATWISEIEEIQNPYMGSKMPKCGKIQREI